MSFNGSGVFSINTAGQPVVTGTTITSTAFNAFTADIATGLSTAMLKDGTQTATAGIGFFAGTVLLPGIYLGTDTATGLYRIGANNDGYSINGTKLLDLSAALLGLTGAMTISSTLAVNGATLSTSAATFTAFAGATTLLTIGGTGTTAVFAIPGTLDASGTTGALTVAGGGYLAKALNVAGVITGSGAGGAGEGVIVNSTSGGSVRLADTNASGSARDWSLGGRVSGFATAGMAYSTTKGGNTFTTVQEWLTTGISITGTVGSSGGMWPGATQTSAALISQASSGAGTTTTYIGNAIITAVSDRRLKTGIVNTQRDALEIVNRFRVVDHGWDDPSDQGPNNRNSRGLWMGMIAQEAIEHAPWIVNKPLSDTDAEGNPQYWFMDFNYAVPLLVRAIQQLSEGLK